jgi:quinol monooxygenase YgiN
MWAQLIKFRVKPGKEANLARGFELLLAAEQPDSGLLRESVLQDQKDPSTFYALVVFESEDKARAREQDPRRTEGLQAVNAIMADTMAGPPEFVDLTVVEDWLV